MDDAAEERILDEVNRWLAKHENDENVAEKVRRYRSLLRTNRALESKLKKLKLLYEKKNAQYAAMKEAVDLEKELYDADLQSLLATAPTPAAQVAAAASGSAFAELAARMRRLSSVREKQEFFLKLVAHFSALFGPVKEYATHGRMSDDVLDSCLEIFGQEHPHALFVPTKVVQRILISATSQVVFEALNSLRAADYASCCFVLCAEGPVTVTKHWSLLLYTKTPAAATAAQATSARSAAGIYHYDSVANENREMARKFSSLISVYFNTEQFYEVRCAQQERDGESGLYVVETMTKLLPMLKSGSITVDNVNVSLDQISLLKVFPMKCRVLVLKLYLQRKLQLFRDMFAA